MTLACYTLNPRDRARRLLALCAATVFTDRPDLWRLDEMGEGGS